MPYKTLKKAFYLDSTSDRYANAARLAESRLSAESSFRTGVESDAGEFFLAVPRELSVLNENILRHERRIASGMRMLPPVAQRAMVRSLVIDEVVSTNDIEGVYSTRRQINSILEDASLMSDRTENRRFRELAKLYLDLYGARTERPATPEDIRAIYDRVMQGEPLAEDEHPDGRLFRKGEVEIIGTGSRVVHVGMHPESRIIETIEHMLSIANSDEIPDTYGAVLAHFLFEYAHPFYDGNGRTGRYLLALHLSDPLSTLTALSLSRVIAENRDAYYKSFREAEHPLNHGELTHFVMNVLDDVRVAQGELDEGLAHRRSQLDAVNEELDAFQKRHQLSEKAMDAVYMLAQLELFATFPEVMQIEVASHIELSVQQSRVYTKELRNAGIIVSVSKRPARFRLAERAAAELGLRQE